MLPDEAEIQDRITAIAESTLNECAKDYEARVNNPIYNRDVAYGALLAILALKAFLFPEIQLEQPAQE
jgi:hypothetical protein